MFDKIHAKINQYFLKHHDNVARRLDDAAFQLFSEAEHALEGIKALEQQAQALKEHRVNLLNQYGCTVDKAQGQRKRTQQIKALLS